MVNGLNIRSQMETLIPILVKPLIISSLTHNSKHNGTTTAKKQPPQIASELIYARAALTRCRLLIPWRNILLQTDLGYPVPVSVAPRASCFDRCVLICL